MRREVLLLTLVLCVRMSSGQGILGPNWTKNLLSSINQLNTNIQGNVQRVTQEIQNSVQAHLTEIEEMKKAMSKEIGNVDPRSLVFSNGGSTIVINEAGTSRTIFSGRGANGEPYLRDSLDRIVGGTLHRTDRIYNPTTRKMEEYRYSLDLNNPYAKPVPE